MKFQCERCKTRYSIADDKVRGKILKIRCKSCAAIITVRDGAPARPAVEAGAPVAGAARPRPSTVEISAGALALASTAEVPAAAAEWYLAIDGAQEGPFSAEQAQARVAAKAPGVEMFAWRDDFVEWVPVEEVPVLAVHLRRPRPAPPPPPSGARRAVTGPHAVRAGSGMSPLPLAPPAATATPPVAADPEGLFARDPLVRDDTDAGDPFAAAAGTKPGAPPPPDAADELPPPPKPSAAFDFDIGEASRMVKLPILAPGPRPAERAASGGLPGVAPPDAEPATPAKPRPDQSLQLAIASMSGSMAAPPVGGATAQRRRRLGVPLVAGGMAMTGVLAGVFLLSRAGDDSARASASETRTSVLVDNFYSKDNPLLAHEAPHAPAAPPAAAPAADPGAKSGPKVASLAPRPRAPGAEAPLHLEPVTRPEPPRIVGPARTGKSDTFDGELGPADPLTPDDVRNTYAANEVGLKRCYERSLKADPTSNVTKMVVKITISPQGSISEISVPDRATDLGSCVANSIRSWRFRRSSGEFTTEFTVFFAKRS